MFDQADNEYTMYRQAPLQTNPLGPMLRRRRRTRRMVCVIGNPPVGQRERASISHPIMLGLQPAGLGDYGQLSDSHGRISNEGLDGRVLLRHKSEHHHRLFTVGPLCRVIHTVIKVC